MATKATTNLLAITETAIGTVTVGAAYALSASSPFPLSGLVTIAQAQVTTTAPAAGSPVTIEVNLYPAGTNDDLWTPLFTVTPLGTTAAVTDTTTQATVAGASTTVTMTGATTLGARSGYYYIRDSSAAGEWLQCVSQAANKLTFADKAYKAHASGASVYSQAAAQCYPVDLSGFARIRARVDNNAQATGPTVATRVDLSLWSPTT